MAGKKKTSDSAAAATVAKQAEKLKKVAAEETAAAAAVEEIAKSTAPTKKGKKVPDKEEPTPTIAKTDTAKDKPKRPPTAYQLFKTSKLAELREEYDDEETRPGYKDLLKMVNEAWHETNPKKPAPAKKEPGQKRAPSAYNIFVKETMPIIKKEHEGSDKKQTDYMALIAKMWNEKKKADGIK
jgi:hypothetical protein